MSLKGRAWAEVNLGAVKNNILSIKESTKAKLMLMVKADGYGHGAVEIAKIGKECGASYLGVACVDELCSLREAGVDLPILIVGATSLEDLPTAIKYDGDLTVFSEKGAKEINDIAGALNKKARVHIKIDTGMSRLGFFTDEIKEAESIARLKNIEIIGAFTHLTSADDIVKEPTMLQFERFMEFTNTLRKDGVEIPSLHVCNSAATLLYPEMHLDMVRPGLSVYGSYPSEFVENNSKISLERAMTVKAKIMRIHEIKAGTTVSYGMTFTAPKTMKIGTVSIGYGDGYSRSLSNKGIAVVNGQAVKIIGRVCMDLCIVDLSDVTAHEGDEITMMGKDFTAEEIAKIGDTISYEIYCLIGKRLPRIYTF